MIAIALPSRGLLFTLVMESLEEERIGKDVKIFFSNGLPIPDAQNQVVERILKEDNVEAIWFVEEDTIPPPEALDKLLRVDADIAFIDYGVGGWSCSAKVRNSEEVLWCGCGCTLVKREVFDKMEKPWFRTDKSLRLNDFKWIDIPMKYGGQDIWFCCKARELGFKIIQVEGECKHMKIDALGTPETNEGRHLLSQKPVIEKWQIIERPELTKDNVIDNVSIIGKLPLA